MKTVFFLFGCLFTLLLNGDEPPSIQPAFIFDCDGVLVDTEHLKYIAWKEALAKYNIDFSIEEYKPLVGLSACAILQAIEQQKNCTIHREVLKLRNQKYQQLQHRGVPPIEPMIEFVKTLFKHKPSNIKLGLASSAPREEIMVNLRQIGLADVFDAIVSGHDDLDAYVDVAGKNKPKPYIYLETAKKLGVHPASCIVFEDTAAGIEAAAKAGMIAIAIPNPLTQQQDFSQAHAIIHSHEELSAITETFILSTP